MIKPAQLNPTGRTETLSALFFIFYQYRAIFSPPQSSREQLHLALHASNQEIRAERRSQAPHRLQSESVYFQNPNFFPPLPIYSKNNQVFWDVVIFTPRRIPKPFAKKVRAHERLSESAESGKTTSFLLPLAAPPPAVLRSGAGMRAVAKVTSSAFAQPWLSKG